MSYQKLLFAFNELKTRPEKAMMKKNHGETMNIVFLSLILFLLLFQSIALLFLLFLLVLPSESEISMNSVKLQKIRGISVR